VHVLVCVKRVPAPGARIVLTEDGQRIDTRHLGFTVSPHEECAVEEAVRLVEAHGGRSTVLTLGGEAAEEQLRTAMSMGIDDAVLLHAEDGDTWDPMVTAEAIAAAVRTLEAEGGGFDLVLFGAESADAGHQQVGIRVAHALGRAAVTGIKQLEVGEGTVTLRRTVPDGAERYELGLPAVVAVKEGLNLPRFPAMRGRLKAKKAPIRRLRPEPVAGGLRTLGLRATAQQQPETVVLGQGAEAAPAVADLLVEVGLL
jgi:electron transfer flavoprotein beta subunit